MNRLNLFIKRVFTRTAEIILHLTMKCTIGLVVFLSKRKRYKKLLWALLFLYLVFGVMYSTGWFHIDRGVLIGIITFQMAFALYLIAITKKDNVDHRMSALKRIFESTQDFTGEVLELVSSYSEKTLLYSQRKTQYVVFLNIAMCPFISLASDIVQRIIVLLTIRNSLVLIICLLVHQLEVVFERPLVSIRKRINEYLERIIKKLNENQGAIIALFILIFGLLTLHRMGQETTNVEG